jgi:hypothetical protein
VPERKFRWAVGELDGRQAPPWTLTVRGLEFTLAVRVHGGRGHVSFHASGERHWRFESALALARAGGPTTGRDADVWQAPDPVNGVITEFTLIVPTTELRLPAGPRLTTGITWIPAAPFGEVVRIVIARQPAGGRSVVGVWSASLGSGEEVVVATVTGPLNREEAALLDRARRELSRHAADGQTLADPAAFEWGHAADRSRFWMTVAPP